MHASNLEVVLDYDVEAPSHLVFNIEAARSGAQTLTTLDASDFDA